MNWETQLLNNVTDELTQRFWQKVNKNGDCWLWEGGCFDDGYGAFCVLGRTRRAHRVAWIITFGSLPEKLLVCHKCDHPRCVRPSHLFLGTIRENALDAMQKGRLAYGKRNGSILHPQSRPKGDQFPQAKLTASKVQIIREVYSSGSSSMEKLGKQFDVSAQTIFRIVHGRAWVHLMGGSNG